MRWSIWNAGIDVRLEFPPFISGGLGTACYGLTKALGNCGTEITFVLPKAVGSELRSHVNLLAPQSDPTGNPPGKRTPQEVASTFTYEQLAPQEPATEEFTHVTFQAIPAKVPAPYQNAASNNTGSFFAEPTPNAKFTEQQYNTVQKAAREGSEAIRTSPRPGFVSLSTSQTPPMTVSFEPGSDVDYNGDLLTAVNRYAGLSLDLIKDKQYDVVHAHDWLTFPAGAAVAQKLGLPSSSMFTQPSLTVQAKTSIKQSSISKKQVCTLRPPLSRSRISPSPSSVHATTSPPKKSTLYTTA